jgi:ribosome maturation factor RimP
MDMDRSEIEPELERRVGEKGFELVELVWAGSKKRPVLRVRIDLPDSEPGHGVSVGDCAAVSRALEPWLDAHPSVPERYVLEVSSPGVERPLRRTRDWVRFTGREVVVRGREALWESSTRLEGELLGVEGEGEEASVRLRLSGGDEVTVPLNRVSGAHLAFRWK